MQRFGVREVEKLLHLPRRTIHGLVRAGFVSPERGPRQAYLFSFQDLIVLRTAQALATAKVPARRIAASLRELRRHLPDSMPLSGLSIGAVGERVVVKEGAKRWQAESGQYLLAFEGDPLAGELKVIDKHTSLEDAIDRGYLLHESGKLKEAEAAYREALDAWGPDPLLLYNLGVLLEDLDRKAEAAEAYRAALQGDPAMADCHYNLALLCEQLRRPQEAIRHMAQYRRLVVEK
ncbi:MAG TPA: tetratricopeptide repeat protein [Burkholderiales bacterium]|nr:tetratricopeptide repeat protein [Burkholderiales bacterium]